MSTLSYINISLHILCFIISSIIMVCCLTEENKKDKQNRLLILFIASYMVMLIANVTKVFFLGVTQPGVYLLLRVLIFLLFCFGPVLLAAFTGYLVTIIKNKAAITKNVRIAVYIAYASCAADVILTVISQFTNIYYYVDEKNINHRREWIRVSDLCSVVCMVITAGIVFYYRKKLSKREIISLISYILLPLLLLPINAMNLDFDPIMISISLVILIFYIGIQSEQGKQLKQKELELTNARVDIMLSQIQPHFLYNTLATIEALCNKDNSKAAAKMVRDFSNYIRENMDSLTQKELVSFNREMEHVKIYLDIEKQRLRERLTVVYDLEVTDFQLPILTVQPLVENAVRYGILKKHYGGTITISTCLVPEGVKITVSDDGVGFDPENPKQQEERSHIGIENVRERLRTQCGGTLTIKSEIGKGTVCTIIILQEGDRL